jgi:pimeloyl-ACP methyl ester carboxylesterase
MLTIGPHRVPYWRVGRGPDLLFIHGWPLHAGSFHGVVSRLADRFTCHLVDLPGAGRSEWDTSADFSFDGHTATLREVVSRIDLRAYAVVAHDTGGVMARLLAADDQRVRALLLTDTDLSNYRPFLLRLYTWSAKTPGTRMFEASMGSRWMRRSGMGLGGCFYDVDRIDGDFEEMFLAPLLRSRKAQDGQRMLLRDFDWARIDKLAEVHARIRAPALLIWGPENPWFPLNRAQGMVKEFAGGARLHALPHGKLFSHYEFPEEFVQEARPFLDAQLSAPSPVLAR